jgi:hypothetical protein
MTVAKNAARASDTMAIFAIGRATGGYGARGLWGAGSPPCGELLPREMTEVNAS